MMMRVDSVAVGLALVATTAAQFAGSSTRTCLSGDSCHAFNQLAQDCLTSAPDNLNGCLCSNAGPVLSQILACCSNDAAAQQEIKSEYASCPASLTAVTTTSPTPTAASLIAAGASSSASAAASSSPATLSSIVASSSVGPSAAITGVSAGSSASSSSQQVDSSNTTLSGGAIAGIAIGGAAAGALVIAALAYFLCFRRMRQQQKQHQQPPMPPPQQTSQSVPEAIHSKVFVPAEHPGAPLNPQNLDQHLASQEWAGMQQAVPQRQTAYQNVTEYHPAGYEGTGTSSSGTMLNHAQEVRPQDAVGESRYGQASRLGDGETSVVFSAAPMTALHPASESVWHPRV